MLISWIVVLVLLLMVLAREKKTSMPQFAYFENEDNHSCPFYVSGHC